MVWRRVRVSRRLGGVEAVEGAEGCQRVPEGADRVQSVCSQCAYSVQRAACKTRRQGCAKCCRLAGSQVRWRLGRRCEKDDNNICTIAKAVAGVHQRDCSMPGRARQKTLRTREGVRPTCTPRLVQAIGVRRAQVPRYLCTRADGSRWLDGLGTTQNIAV